MPSLAWLGRLQQDDGAPRGAWCWNPYTDPPHWQGGRSETYAGMYDPSNHGDSWGYAYVFVDGSRGVSRVRDVEPALRALGLAVNGEEDVRASY
jgi:hypothetical protein